MLFIASIILITSGVNALKSATKLAYVILVTGFGLLGLGLYEWYAFNREFTIAKKPCGCQEEETIEAEEGGEDEN